jgi:uncharacterized membrane protein (UPF0127 family)
VYLRTRPAIATVALIVCLLFGCRPATSLPTVTLSIASTKGDVSEPFIMEVASTPETRTKGLMFRDSLGSREGMLFLFPQQQRLSFWMKNTLIPLDMVFVANDWTVVGVLENVPPLNEAPRYVDANSQYVLEFKAGTVQRVGIVKGAAIRVNGILPPIR